MPKLLPTDLHDPSFVDTAPVRAAGTLRFNAPALAVWNCLADPAAVRRWFGILASSHWTSEPPYGVGSTRYFKANRGRSRGTQVITEWQPGERIAFCNTETPWYTGVRANYEQWSIVSLGPTACEVTLRFGQQLRPMLIPFQVAEMVAGATVGPVLCRKVLRLVARHLNRVGYHRYLPSPGF